MPESIHETKTHGQLTFPYIVYRGNIPEYIHSYPLHWHEEFEIVYVVKGKGLITIQSKEYACSDEDILLIPPGQIHSFHQYKDNQMEYFNILFRFSLLEENPKSICYEKYLLPLIRQQKAVSPYLPPCDPLNKKLAPYLRFLIDHRKRSYTDYELLVKSNLFAILHHINEAAVSTTSEMQSRVEAINKIKPLLEYVHQNYASELSIRQAASLSGFSESHFMKLFKSITGKSFTQYVNCYRLEIAAKELRSTNEKITEIAGNVGFHNFSYFIRAFTRIYGVSPSVYRKNNCS